MISFYELQLLAIISALWYNLGWLLNYSKFRLILRYCLWQCFAQWIKWQILPGVAFSNLGVSLNKQDLRNEKTTCLIRLVYRNSLESCIACIMDCLFITICKCSINEVWYFPQFGARIQGAGEAVCPLPLPILYVCLLAQTWPCAQPEMCCHQLLRSAVLTDQSLWWELFCQSSYVLPTKRTEGLYHLRIAGFTFFLSACSVSAAILKCWCALLSLWKTVKRRIFCQIW